MKKMLFTLVLFFCFGLLGCETDGDKNLTPALGDYSVSNNLAQMQGDTEPVTVTAKPDRTTSTGIVTVYYRGIQGTTYNKSTANPEDAGSYAVTFDVAAANGWNAAIDLLAGNLYINSGKSGAVLFEIPITDIVGLIAQAGQAQFLAMMRAANPALALVPDATLIPMIPPLILTMLTDLNSLVGIAMTGVTYEALSLESDINFYHDEDGEVEFQGIDQVDENTVFFSTIDFDLIQKTLLGGTPRSNFTVAELLTEIGFSGSISYPLTLNNFLNAVSPGTTIASFDIQGLHLYTAASGGMMNGSTSITGATMTIYSNWPLDDVASMF